jgi:2,3-bisphosphoglycerate-independent phosphoglycerate mutase
MTSFNLMRRLTQKTDAKIVLIVSDGLGGLPMGAEHPLTELETARTPNLDALAARSICGLLDPVAPGITAGSGPAHLSLFGYDPVEFDLGRGILSAYGIRCYWDKEPLTLRNVAARMNFASIQDGKITDRRAGRIADDIGRRLVEKLSAKIKTIDGVKVAVEHEKEYRGALILDAAGLSGHVVDTDPEIVGHAPIKPAPVAGLRGKDLDAAKKTAAVVAKFVAKAGEILKDEHPANFVLLRGFDKYHPLPTFQEVYKLNPAAIATYPMYRGAGRLLGMKVLRAGTTIADEVAALRENWANHDFFFFHVKKTDSYGEDGNFDAKARVIEELDALLPAILDLKPDVIAVTGDHSTPSVLRAHSWHPLPVLIWSEFCRPDDVTRFGERACTAGGLGRIRGTDLMPLLLANARKLGKYGA